MGLRTLSGSIGSALFGATRQSVLRVFFLHADKRYYQREVIRMVGRGSGTVQRELEVLTRAGILVRTVEGRQSYFQAARTCPVFEELQGLVRKTFGIVDVLRTALSPLSGRIALAFVFGSVASGQEREASDIDLFIVADGVSVREVMDPLAESQRELQREINPSLYSSQEFCRRLTSGDRFVAPVVKGQKLFLFGNDGHIERLVEERLAAGASKLTARDRRSVRRRR
ncbi:MAG: nucleotidyltransferase domain-containing protein [Bryobacteraceae bacterium]|nr:nucleotidyltransferase domain-containing protein [Bryobacteraceae bacterium]